MNGTQQQVLSQLDPQVRAIIEAWLHHKERGVLLGRTRLAQQLNLKETAVRKALLIGRQVGLIQDKAANGVDFAVRSSATGQEAYEETGNTAYLNIASPVNPKTLEELVAVCQIDLDQWHIERWVANKWEMGYATVAGAKTQPLYQIKVWLVRKVAKAVTSELPELQPVVFKVSAPKKSSTSNRPFRCAVVVPDPHIGYLREAQTGRLDPFHDRTVIDVTFQLTKLLKPDRVIVLGDGLDLPDWSDKFLKTPEFYNTFQPALYELGWVLAQYRRLVPQAQIDFIPGNHDDRIRKMILKYMMQVYQIKPANAPPNAPAVLSLDNLLGLPAIHVTCHGDYPKGKLWLNKDLAFEHGVDVSQKSGGSVGRILDKTAHSRGTGHTHRLEAAHRTFHGYEGPVFYSAYSFGTCARLDGPIPAAHPEVNWQNGCGVVWYDQGRFHQTDMLHIQQGQAIWKGQLIEGQAYTDQLNHDVAWEY